MNAIAQRPTDVADAPEMNREERLTYIVYVSMAALIAAFLAATLAAGVIA
jgi:hypothetical protein